MLRWPRVQNGHAGWVRSTLPPGGSTCTTSAPKSASSWPTCAPVSVFEKSTARRPSSAPPSMGGVYADPHLPSGGADGIGGDPWRAGARSANTGTGSRSRASPCWSRAASARSSVSAAPCTISTVRSRTSTTRPQFADLVVVGGETDAFAAAAARRARRLGSHHPHHDDAVGLDRRRPDEGPGDGDRRPVVGPSRSTRCRSPPDRRLPATRRRTSPLSSSTPPTTSGSRPVTSVQALGHRKRGGAEGDRRRGVTRVPRAGAEPAADRDRAGQLRGAVRARGARPGVGWSRRNRPGARALRSRRRTRDALDRAARPASPTITAPRSWCRARSNRRTR